MVGNARRRQGLKRRSRTRIRASRLVRRVRLRHTIHAVRQRARAHAHGQPRAPVAAPRLWQRFMIVPLMIIVQGLRSGLVWLRDVILPAPPADPRHGPRALPDRGPSGGLCLGGREHDRVL